jgi:hypothetical protein
VSDSINSMCRVPCMRKDMVRFSKKVLSLSSICVKDFVTRKDKAY